MPWKSKGHNRLKKVPCLPRQRPKTPSASYGLNPHRACALSKPKNSLRGPGRSRAATPQAHGAPSWAGRAPVSSLPALMKILTVPPVTQPSRKEKRGANTADDQRGLPVPRLARRQGEAAADEENGDQEPATNRHVEFPPPLPAFIVAAPPSICNHRTDELSTSAHHKQPN